ncbi:MAG TPA: Clp protease N-terminal domain-containing protein [Candidatus Dormibacteraeota bacterium]|nr:Clp protease N-terminal domain-containing protein [Candidatus Dormibacteraeota bacterium]
MKSTTVRFADPVYSDLEAASRLTGLPINSIVTVACLEWLRRNVEPAPGGLAGMPPGPWRPRAQQLRRGFERELVELVPRPLSGPSELPWLFTLTAQDALGRAQMAAERTRRPWIGTSHLLQGLTEAPGGRAAAALARLGVDAIGLAGPEPGEPVEGSERLLPTRQVRQVLRHAQGEADREGAAQMDTGHLLLGLLLAPDSRVAEALAAAGATEGAVRDALREAPPED